MAQQYQIMEKEGVAKSIITSITGAAFMAPVQITLTKGILLTVGMLVASCIPQGLNTGKYSI